MPPPPAADADAEAATEAKEARVLELTATVDRAMATIAERNAARDEARTALAAARAQLRDVTDALREKQAAARPLQDVVSAAAAAQSEVRDMSRDLRGVTTEAALEEKLAALEYRMSHETLSVLEQKSILRETKLLRDRRADVKHLVEKRASLAEGQWDKDTASAQLKVMRSLMDFLRRQQEETKRLCDDLRDAANVADADAKRAAERRNAAVKERASLQTQLRDARKSGSREKSEFFRARRTAAKARDLARRGEIAEAEALCLEQMERVHARLAADSTYRREYLEGLERAAEESATRRETRAAEAAEAKAKRAAEAEKEAKKVAEAKAAAEANAAAEAKAAERRRERAAAEEAKRAAEAARVAEEEAKKAAAAELARRKEEARRPAPAPDLGPGKLATAMAEAEALHRAECAKTDESAEESERTADDADADPDDVRARRAAKKKAKKAKKKAEMAKTRVEDAEAAEPSSSAPTSDDDAKFAHANGAANGTAPEPPAMAMRSATAYSTTRAHSTSMKMARRSSSSRSEWVATAAALAALAALAASGAFGEDGWAIRWMR